ncbi:SDR family NAD(P)-dependent oxidoreductase [Streptomyces sp. SID14478]|uniref:SDR family NAD(P)-dependent oxidoreductase n=1 Tax=Streptomyces sp. SID14478 TaxID=2706073 RepID=UPI0013DC0A64|nr:SDR family NAD(P)-dependent oxidoreductase [Streptomyces sp. SID14478]NEB79112.1 SDR family NAD(P)-dependent oxidoreductase [Streptomyces sp. SID14478]
MTAKTWFITGASKGFGRQWTQAALERGDRVAATSRTTGVLDDLSKEHGDRLLPIQLDVTDRPAVDAAVQLAVAHFGRLDVVVNNAGYGLFGMVEETSEEQARTQLDVNLLGPLRVTQATLPHLRAQGSGHIIQVSSVAGVFSLPGLGLYHASKFGLEGFTASLAKEVKDFGINVTLVEPAGYATEWTGPSAVHAERLPAYDAFRAAMQRPAGVRGEPAATRAAILAVVDAEQPPLRVFFGKGPLDLMRTEYASRIEEWERWDDVSQAAFGA